MAQASSVLFGCKDDLDAEFILAIDVQPLYFGASIQVALDHLKNCTGKIVESHASARIHPS